MKDYILLLICTAFIAFMLGRWSGEIKVYIKDETPYLKILSLEQKNIELSVEVNKLKYNNSSLQEKVTRLGSKINFIEIRQNEHSILVK